MTENNFDTKKILEGLKEHDGAIQKAADKAEINRNNLVRILKGEWKNWRVVKIAAIVLQELDREKREAIEIATSALEARR